MNKPTLQMCDELVALANRVYSYATEHEDRLNKADQAELDEIRRRLLDLMKALTARRR